MPPRALINPHLTPRPSRRQLLSCAGLAGAAALLARPAQALQMESYTVKEVMSGSIGGNARIAARAGVTGWDLLEKADFNNFTAPATLVPEIAALEGQTIRIEGYVLAVEEGEISREFMLSAYATHCPFCSPGTMASLVNVQTTVPAALTTATLLVEGTFAIDRQSETGLIYYLNNAKVIQAA